MYFQQQSNSSSNLNLLLCNSDSNQSHPSKSISNPSFINYVGIPTGKKEDKNIDILRLQELNDDVIYSEIHTQIPLFFTNQNIIKVSSKVPHALNRLTPKHLLKAIHPDIEVAKEMCLLFLTQLNSTYFDKLNNADSDGWKALKAEYLRELISFDPMAYKRITEALEYPLAKGAILECDHVKVEGIKSFHYRLGENYINKGIRPYELKMNEAKALLYKHQFRLLSESNQNPICRNLIKMYAGLTLPNKEQLIKEAKRLITKGYKTKKGKELKFLNKHLMSYYKHPEQISFVEDGLEIFEYLTNNGLMVPKVGGENSGGRVVDSLTLMPSWIRNLIKWNGKRLYECDYSALHPNIAISLYGGHTQHLKHGDLANDLRLDVKQIKVEHLSFFNKTTHQMKESPLYDYYEAKEPRMLRNIITEKHSTEHKHKITSRRMFAKEVEIMTEVIVTLNAEGIYVLYVYDALLCSPKDTKRVLSLMDRVALKNDVYTTAKFTNDKKHNPLTADVKDKVLPKEILEAITKTAPVPVNGVKITPPINEENQILKAFLQLSLAYDFPKDVAEIYINHINKHGFESIEEMLEDVNDNAILKNLLHTKRVA